MRVNNKLKEIQKEIFELNDKILKIKNNEIKTDLGIERDLHLLSFLESRLKDALIEYNIEFEKTYNEEGMSEGVRFLISVILAAVTVFFATYPKCKPASEEVIQSNISAYEEEQKQIYEAKIKEVK